MGTDRLQVSIDSLGFLLFFCNQVCNIFIDLDSLFLKFMLENTRLFLYFWDIKV
jgi:hypothetical protein